jgi:hypothetical protein
MTKMVLGVWMSVALTAAEPAWGEDFHDDGCYRAAIDKSKQ